MGQRDERFRVPPAEDDRRGAHQDRGLVPDHQPHRVKHRGDHSHDVLAGQPVLQGGGERRDMARPVADHGSLGAAGGAAGEGHRHRGFGVGVPVRSSGRVRRQRLVERRRSSAGRPAGDDHHGNGPANVRREPVFHGGIHDQHLRGGALQDVGDLGGRVQRRNVDQDGPRPRAPEVDDPVFGTVEQQGGDAVAGSGAGRAQQVREPVRQPVVAGEPEPPITRDHRRLPGRAPRRQPEDFTEPHEVRARSDDCRAPGFAPPAPVLDGFQDALPVRARDEGAGFRRAPVRFGRRVPGEAVSAG